MKGGLVLKTFTGGGEL